LEIVRERVMEVFRMQMTSPTPMPTCYPEPAPTSYPEPAPAAQPEPRAVPGTTLSADPYEDIPIAAGIDRAAMLSTDRAAVLNTDRSALVHTDRAAPVQHAVSDAAAALTGASTPAALTGAGSKGERSHQATRRARQAGLDGVWSNGDTTVIIKDGRIGFSTGQVHNLEIVSDSECILRLSGKAHIGRLDPNHGGRLLWSDGDVWTRRLREEHGLDGEWSDGDLLNVIDGTKITFASGEVHELQRTGDTTCMLRMNGTVHHAHLDNGRSKLVWSDGDVWTRRLSDTANKAPPATASTPRAAAEPAQAAAVAAPPPPPQRPHRGSPHAPAIQTTVATDSGNNSENPSMSIWRPFGGPLWENFGAPPATTSQQAKAPLQPSETMPADPPVLSAALLKLFGQSQAAAPTGTADMPDSGRQGSVMSRGNSRTEGALPAPPNHRF